MDLTMIPELLFPYIPTQGQHSMPIQSEYVNHINDNSKNNSNATTQDLWPEKCKVISDLRLE